MALKVSEFIHENPDMELFEDLELTKIRPTNIENVDEKISRFYIYLDNRYKRIFDLEKGDKFIGEIDKIGKNSVNPIENLSGEKINFLIKEKSDNRIYLSKNSYQKLKNKDVKTGFFISVKIDEAMRYTKETEYGEKIDIFPRQKVEEP